jgi:hypothetical protein
VVRPGEPCEDVLALLVAAVPSRADETSGAVRPAAVMIVAVDANTMNARSGRTCVAFTELPVPRS